MSHRYVSETFWTDPYVDGLDPSEKLLYIYLLTNPQCNIAGIDDHSPSRAAAKRAAT